VLVAGVVAPFSSASARADSVLDHLPQDAAGCVYFRDLQSLDSKLLGILAPTLPPNPIVITPSVILQGMIGPDARLDLKGEFLVAVLSSKVPLDRRQFCFWLPVADYEQFARALGGKPEEPITVVTISGEDLLCARVGRWAFVADPNERQRLKAMLDEKPSSPPQLAEMREWLLGQEAAALVFLTPALREAAQAWASEGPAPRTASPGGDDLFRPIDRSANDESFWGQVRGGARRLVGDVATRRS
jgi:hypothetical protein